MSVYEKVHLVLRRRLMSGFYDPGTQLKEEVLATEMGVSRTPVRKAIQSLTAEGLLESAENRGARVTQWGRKDVEDIFKLRTMLEGLAAAMAAEHITAEQLSQIESCNAGMEKAATEKKPGYLERIQKLNYSFHYGILEACGSPHLRKFGASLLDYPLIIGGFYIYSHDEMMASIRQHAEILAALRARNAQWATAAVTCHLAAAIERFRRSEDIRPAADQDRPRNDPPSAPEGA
ncbi:MAG: GntR family transcriptional regulator [Paracoccus sp. (in: a-proteobacteria)]|nr:GntR family transcriptional regulator [Paracoccus sp. (in: a-proteobacteria)]